jgi:AbrB family looped-hinge helix DNA binding protein
MAKVTSKLQLTIPKAVAEEYGIRPGDELDLTPAGEVIRMAPRGRQKSNDDLAGRLRLFDQATERQRRRRARRSRGKAPGRRGWRREDLYTRGLAR